MGKTQLYYKGQHQPHGLVNVKIKDVEELLKTDDFCLPNQENVNDENSRTSISSRKVRKNIKREEEQSE